MFHVLAWRSASLSVALGFLALAGPAATAAETPPFPTDGLFLYLDAARQSAARASAGLPGVANGSPLERWLDSATNRNALQPWAASRPVFRADENEAFVRFDGKDDFLSVSGAKHRVAEATVFVLAAPRSNKGPFTGIFGTAASGRNDYTSGLNLDQGPTGTRELTVLNVESAGSVGFRNFLQPGRNLASGVPFDSFHVFTVRSTIGPKGTELFLDGIKLGDRPRTESRLGLDELIIGGRLYSNDPGEPPMAQGTFHGDIAAVLVYERAVSETERRSIEESLFGRTAALNALASGSRGHALETLKDSPLVQMFVPGFSVEELPLALRNLTGLRYRHDGKLVALGYDGRIHLGADSDGDGREDRATIFWDKSSLRGPIGMALLPAGDARGDGVFVASKGKVSLILDKDRDGVGDEEIIVATGWKEITQSVDAVGLAVDPRDGSIYFGMGTENFANGYLIDAGTGRSRFDLKTEHGTIQRVTADFKKRETVCTGVRFTCALAFNRNGDLFASEQEGATWLANGNPLDELLHIQPGLHYGFPPRHPKHLPQVIDEPAVFEYGPQHQSTVGMIFNEGVNGGPAWGPVSWAGDALLCGESRGKLYRTRLTKTPAGYVAQNHLIASLGMLLVDTCVTPAGDLLLACHSGPPDWGTGPAGEGKIFRVRYAGKETPQPVLAWASGPDEFRVAFDRPLRDADWAGVREKTRIEAGRYVAAGDRFETIRPGYQVVRDQMTAPRRWVDVQSLTLTLDRRTLVLRVPRQTEAVSFAVTLPTPTAWRVPSAIEQKPQIDLVLGLNGVLAVVNERVGASGGTGVTGAPTTSATTGTSGDSSAERMVLPHPTLSAARAFAAGSADHEAFLKRLEGSVGLELRGQIDLGNIFVPAVQPGSSLDWDITTDAFARRTMGLQQDYSTAAAEDVTPAPRATGSTVAPLQLAVGGKIKTDGAGFTYALDDKVRPVTMNRVWVPWAMTAGRKAEPATTVRTDVHGRWLAGRRVFFGDGGCATCHTMRGEGMAFGPDLSNLIHRDRESVLHDITQPSATLNPDMIGMLVKFKDDTSLNGLVQTLDDRRIVLRLPANTQVERPRSEVASLEPMKTSLMTENLGQTFSAEQLEDLLTFLLTAPLEPTRITRMDPPMPPARTREELAPFLPSAGAVPAAAAAPMRILLCIDDKDHGTDEHDYPLFQERWAKLLGLAEGVTVTTAQPFPTPEQLAAADVMVFYSRNSQWDAKKAAMLDEFQQRGGGLVLIHWAMEGRKEALSYAERVGLATGTGSKYRHGEMELNFTDQKHPITAGFKTLRLVDETYWAFHGDEHRVSVLARSVEENAPQTQLWAYEHLQGRVFGSIPGHYMWTFDDPLYRVILLRGIAWAAKQDVSRLLELTTVGARIAP